MPGDELKEREWIKAFVSDKLKLILCKARNPHDPSGYPQCFGIAQHATLESDGHLLYHEGFADDKITDEKKQRHAWNTFCGIIVDLSLTQQLDGSLTILENAYENYVQTKSCSVEEVRAVLKRRNGGLDWIENPEYPEHRDEIQP